MVRTTQSNSHVVVLYAAGVLIPLGVLLLFVHAYSWPYPIDDQWMDSVPIAVSAMNGTLSLPEMLKLTGGGHRVFFTHLHTVLFSLLLDWPTRLEACVNPALAVANFGLLVLLFRRSGSGRVRQVLVPFAALVFCVFQGINWIMAWQSGWHFVNLFFLASLCVLVARPAGWIPLLAAALLSACATISRSHGILLWPLIIPMLWMRGYRQVRHYAVWVFLSSLAALLYLSGTGIAMTSSAAPEWQRVNFGSPLLAAHVFLGQMGANLGLENYPWATVVGLAGVGLVLVNAWYVRAHTDRWSSQGVWVIVACYAMATSLLISAARPQVMGEESVAMLHGYATSSVLLWVSLVALIAIAMPLTRRDSQPRTHHLLRYANLAAIFIMPILYLPTQLQTLREFALLYGNRLGTARPVDAVDRCLIEFPLKRDFSCLGVSVEEYVRPHGDEILALADHGLALFAAQPPVSVLPQAYRPGSPVVINTPSPWLNAYVRDRMLPDLPENLLLHLTPSEVRKVPIHGFPRPLQNTYPALTADAVQRLRAYADAGLEMWYITAPEAAFNDDGVFAAARMLDYAANPVDPTPTRYRDMAFQVYRLSSPPGVQP